MFHYIGRVPGPNCVAWCWDGDLNECVFAHRLEGSADVSGLLSPLDCHDAQMLKITRPPDSQVKGSQSVKNANIELFFIFRKVNL